MRAVKTANPWLNIAVLGTPACRRVSRTILPEPRAEQLAQPHSGSSCADNPEAIQRAFPLEIRGRSRSPRRRRRPRLRPPSSSAHRRSSANAGAPHPQLRCTNALALGTPGSRSRIRCQRRALDLDTQPSSKRKCLLSARDIHCRNPHDGGPSSSTIRPPHAVRPLGSAALAARDSCLGAPPEQPLPFRTKSFILHQDCPTIVLSYPTAAASSRPTVTPAAPAPAPLPLSRTRKGTARTSRCLRAPTAADAHSSDESRIKIQEIGIRRPATGAVWSSKPAAACDALRCCLHPREGG
ncbi:hypothetical protein MSAN_02090600 [Mycena sanguinolenta]|uniref:Uncharacterized protein n=1 Tax=Mycena sanguinolenta TaxID=230812 RepID=A0A8H6XIB9_9AGAR|nr:hypothetical protein MSAN_02090600 [Mycena sanguinolenta]